MPHPKHRLARTDQAQQTAVPAHASHTGSPIMVAPQGQDGCFAVPLVSCVSAVVSDFCTRGVGVYSA